MRRLIVIVVSVCLAMTVLVTGALAAPPHRGCPVGPASAGSSTIGAWELMDQATLADAIEASGFDPAEAEVIVAKNDRNSDGLICVMTQLLPNTASGSDTWFIGIDNNIP